MTKILHRIPARPASDGAGVKIKRVVPMGDYGVMDPFLMLDEIRSETGSDYAAGFPSHPHRGFETVTYMRQGQLEHRDHMGNQGVIQAGGAQWMTAGRGVIHSEMPLQKDGAFHGFQLWLNLPADEKLRPAEYHNLEPADIPLVVSGSHRIHVLGGDWMADGDRIAGPIRGRTTEPQLWDLELNGTDPLTLKLDPALKTLLFVYEGQVRVGGKDGEDVHAAQMISVQHEGAFPLQSTQHVQSNQQARVLLLAGRPLKEPVVQYGPFVMNTREQIEEAIQDYQLGTLTSRS
ncbi:pirin family protein [Ketobacter sp.]|uniref:pirin family protein n=1 Tax=Ketobacter sp. TaxID=2083498 RepID=UPI000F290C4C|nr:pirin family protein [Ketobacter sp.]RLT99402.1 MAG: pirin family protein [Ketobacter sp.]